MEHTINITIRDKIAVQSDKTVYVCGNSDFIVSFDFDDEWNAHLIKTARFIYDGKYTDVVFEGNQCPVPVLSDTHNFKVGVFAGDLKTSTPAYVGAKKSILCENGNGTPVEPTPDVYNQMVELFTEKIEEVNEKTANIDQSIHDALQEAKDSGEFDGADGKDGVDGKDGYTPVKGIDYFDGVDGKDGYTPVKDVDYRDGKDGKDGKDGYTPVKGVDYFDGKDGKDGHTPEKGVDYFTDEDIQEVVDTTKADLIANGQIGYAEEGKRISVFEGTVNFDYEPMVGGYFCYMILTTLEAGATYVVEFDGQEYICTAFALGGNDVGLGDRSLAMGGSGDVLPFYFDVHYDGTCYAYSAIEKTAIPTNIWSLADAVVHTIDPKFIPTDSIVESVIAALRELETDSIDMTDWANGSFTETYVNGTSTERTVTFDTNGRPTNIENPDGGSVSIEW